jgi:uncharacterized protein YbjT (DUF2867 family)
MTNAARPLVLVTGATGKQGGATVAKLLSSGKTRIRALTRDPSSPKAQNLAKQGVEIVRGDFDDSAAIRAALNGISAAFSVQTFEGKGGLQAEERQGIAFAEAAKEAGAHLVYSSVDGAERQSGVPHFNSKWRIEQRIEKLDLNATILRPVAFMENFAIAPFSRAIFLGMMKAVMGVEHVLQLVSVQDIGWFAARALEDPSAFADRKIAIAGDGLNLREIGQTYKNVTGKAANPAPIPGFMPKLVLPRDLYLMLKWFAMAGYTANINAIRAEHPEVSSFESWLQQST